MYQMDYQLRRYKIYFFLKNLILFNMKKFPTVQIKKQDIC